MNLNNLLRINRPELSDSSIKTYSSILFNLYTSVFGTVPLKIENFNNYEEITNYLNFAKEPNVRKTILSALFVLTKNPDYQNDMLDNIKAYTKEISKQEKTPSQKESWLTSEEIEDKFNFLKISSNNAYKSLNQLINKFGNKDLGKTISKPFQIIQDFIILCLLSGIYIPPRRSKDYVEFKIHDINFKIDNFIKGNKFYFNSYKGSNIKGLQIVDIPKSLKTILAKWIKLNPTNHLLFDSEFNQLSNVKLTQRLNKIFDKKASVNSLRHSFLTEKHYTTIDKINDLEKDMKMMGSSILQAKVYIKK